MGVPQVIMTCLLCLSLYNALQESAKQKKLSIFVVAVIAYIFQILLLVWGGFYS